MLDDDGYASISEMADAETPDRGHLGRLLQLTPLAPDIVEAIVDGRQAQGITLADLPESMQSNWSEKRSTR